MPTLAAGSVTALLAASAALFSAPLGAQQPETPLLRGGQLSLFFQPVVSIFDERFGFREDFEGIEPLAYDFTDDALSARSFPGLITAEQMLAGLAQDSSFTLNMGAVDARMSSIVYRLPISLSLGVFDWLTVGGTVPFVKRRTEFDVGLRGGNANVGLSPGTGDPVLLGFLAEAQTAIASVLASVDAICMAAGDMDPGCLDGRDFLTEASAFLTGIQSAYDNPLFLFESSPAAAMLNARVAQWRADLRMRGDSVLVDSVFVSPLPFATQNLTLDQYQKFITDNAYGVTGTALGDFTSLWELGDIEIWGAIRLLSSREDPATWEPPTPETDSAGVPMDLIAVFDSLVALDTLAADSLLGRPSEPSAPSIGYLLGIQGLYRLGTGTPDLPGNFVDLGSGDGQNDVEVRVFGRLDIGRRLRTRFDVTYGIQSEGEVAKRLAAVDNPFAPITTEGLRPWDPGDYLDIRIAPEIRLTPEFSLGARYRRYHRDADRWDFGDTSALPDDENPALLNEETEQDVRYLGIGVTLWPTEKTRVAGQWPIALSAEYLRASSGSGGRTPRDSRFRVSGRLFFELW